MYTSTVDVLYNLYDRLSLNGYVIMDDWWGFASKCACLDFFAWHKIDPEIVWIDKVSAYWQKTEEVEVQYHRYETSRFEHPSVNRARCRQFGYPKLARGEPVGGPHKPGSGPTKPGAVLKKKR